MEWGARAICWLNRFWRRPGVEGRESPEAYSRWEYRWGKALAEDYLAPQGDLDRKRVLDIGCGLGGKTVAYGEAGVDLIVGVDLSVPNLEASERFVSSGDGGFRWLFVAGDAGQLPLPSGCFDTVVANDAMEHFAAPEAAVAEMTRVTRPGGSIWVFFTPHFSPLGSHLYDYIYIPWCHLLFQRHQLAGAIRRILAARNPAWSSAETAAEVDRIMRSYDTELNRMSVRRFFRILRRMGGVEVTFVELKPAKFGFLRVATRVPILRELFTGTVVCRLARTG